MKAKRLLSIVLAAILAVGCFCMTAAAAEPVVVSLLGEKQAIAGEEYEVTLRVKESVADAIGGISCEVNYDANKFELKRVEITQAFADANHYVTTESAQGNIINNNATAGTIKIVLLGAKGDKAENNWLTLVFTVKTNSGAAQFSLENVQSSNAAGTSLVEKDPLSVNVINNTSYTKMANVNGASIRKDGVGNIRFEAEILDKTKVAEIGFLMLPAACLNNGDLTVTDSGKYTMADGNKVTIASGSKNISSLKEDESKFYCYLTNTTSFKLTTKFAARAYVKLTDGTYIYSDNQTYSDGAYVKDIKGGTSAKSCISVAKAIYDVYSGTNNLSAIAEIIAKTNSEWSAEDYQTVVNELAKCEDSIH